MSTQGAASTLHLAKPALDAAEMAGLLRERLAYGAAPASPWLSVVVVAYHEGASLMALLAAVAQQLEAWPDPAGAELILVDNGLSAEIRAQVAARFSPGAVGVCHLVATGNLGCSEGRNLGVAHARAPWVAFLDADGAIDATYLRACAEAIQLPDVVAVRGRVRPLVPTRGLPSHYDLGEARRAAPISAEGISLWQRAAFAAAGGFEAALAGGEGPVLCYRMTERLGVAPAAFVYEPALCLWHDYYADPRHLRAKLGRYAAARLAIERRYPLYAAYLAQFTRLNAARGLPTVVSRASTKVMVAWVRARLEAELASEGVARHDQGDGAMPAARVTMVYAAACATRARQCLGVTPGADELVWGAGGTHATLADALASLAPSAPSTASPNAPAEAPPRLDDVSDFVLVVPSATGLTRATLPSLANIFAIAPTTALILPWLHAPARPAGEPLGLPGEVRDPAWLARNVASGPWAVRRAALASPGLSALWRDDPRDERAWTHWLARHGAVRALRLVDSLVPPRVRRARWPSRWALVGVRAVDRVLGLGR